MSIIAERIPLFVPESDIDTEISKSVFCRAVTHRGLVRLHNEDAFCYLSKENRALFAVADGLGGHRGGAIASQIAIDTIKTEFGKWKGKGSEHFVTKTIQNANLEIYNTAQDHPELFSMQTTATVVALEKGSIAIGHVGDCRLYRVRNGHVTVLTKDHSQAADYCDCT